MMLSAKLAIALSGALAAAGNTIGSTLRATVTNSCVAGNPNAVPFTRDLAVSSIQSWCQQYQTPGQPDAASFSLGSDGAALEVQIKSCRDPVSPGDTITEQMCSYWLQSAVDNCDTDTTTQKYGNYMTVTADGGYCMEYIVLGYGSAPLTQPGSQATTVALPQTLRSIASGPAIIPSATPA